MAEAVPPERSLSGRTAIVTGAGKGLGRAYALALAARGAQVVVNNRQREGQVDSAAAVVAEIQVAGGQARANYVSAEQPEAGEQLLAAALDNFGGLDIVVANAGLDQPRSFHKQSLAEFERIFAVNFMGTARLLHATWPVLRQATHGRALVSASSAGLYGNHGQAAYAASKAALIGLMKSLAIESAAGALRINAIAPYAVTPLTRPWFPEHDAQRFSAAAVASLVAWLVSENCQLSGQVVIAGGGGLRLARALETDTVVPGGSFEVALEQLQQTNPTYQPATANEEFEAFAWSLRD